MAWGETMRLDYLQAELEPFSRQAQDEGGFVRAMYPLVVIRIASVEYRLRSVTKVDDPVLTLGKIVLEGIP